MAISNEAFSATLNKIKKYVEANYVQIAELADYGVSGAKGGAESEYRTGQVNITKENIGLGNVNNTSDADKPISTKTQQAINSLSTSVNNSLGNKVDKVSGKGLSTNDLTNDLKNKLDGIESGAEVNQSAFSYVKVNGSSIAADQKKDTFEIKGENITLSLDLLNDIITMGLTQQNVIDALGYTPAASQGSKVSFTQRLTSGTEIGSITIDNNTSKLYAPLILALKSAILSNTEAGKVVDSLIVKEIINMLPFGFGVDEDGNYGYYKDGADTVTPFKSGKDESVEVVDGFELVTMIREPTIFSTVSVTGIIIADGFEPISATIESV